MIGSQLPPNSQWSSRLDQSIQQSQSRSPAPESLGKGCFIFNICCQIIWFDLLPKHQMCQPTLPGDVSRIHSHGLSLSLLVPSRSPDNFFCNIWEVQMMRCNIWRETSCLRLCPASTGTVAAVSLLKLQHVHVRQLVPTCNHIFTYILLYNPD